VRNVREKEEESEVSKRKEEGSEERKRKRGRK